MFIGPIGFGHDLPVDDLVTRRKLHLNVPPVIGPNTKSIASPVLKIPNTSILGIDTTLS